MPLYLAEETSFTGIPASEAPNNISQCAPSSRPQDSVQAYDVTLFGREIQSDDHIGNLDQLLENLKSRGSGTCTCPYGPDCRKGCVGEDGELVVFTHNSEFRYTLFSILSVLKLCFLTPFFVRAHVEKHMKRYTCNLPNCPTRKGFSRA
jgi:hypothetical protein